MLLLCYAIHTLLQVTPFSGIEKLKAVIETKPSVHKKLVKIGMLGTYKNVTAKDIRQMKRVCKQHGDTLKIIDDKICMEEEADVDVVLKMFGDYYKQGEVSGKSYGTFSGKELKK